MDKEEKKNYGFVGTVTISTEEYRDLITANAELQCDLKEVSDKKTEYYWEKYRLENELKELKPKYEKLLMFINEAEGAKDKYKLWKLDQEADDEK